MNEFSAILDISRLRSWGVRGGMAILDQGAYSGSNFVLNILLARWLTQEDYGAFSVAFTVVLFLSGLHNAIQLEPMSVIGPANFSDHLNDYLYAQIRLNFIITVPTAILVALAGVALRSFGVVTPYLSQVLIAAGFALPFLFFLWVVRRTFYVRQQPNGALMSSVLYAVLVMIGLWVAHRYGMDSSITGFGLMGLSSLISGTSTIIWYRKGKTDNLKFIHLNEVMTSHWNFGKWALAAAALSVAAGQIQILLTAGMINLEAAGAFKAMQNFIMPMVQTIAAISILGLPALSADFGRKDYASLRRKGLFISGALTGMAVLYFVALWLLAVPLDQWLYGGKYSAYVHLIAPLGLVPIFIALTTGFSLILRSIQKVQFYLIGGIISGIVGIVSGFIMIKTWGITGSAISMMLTYLISFISTFVLYKMWFPYELLVKKSNR